MTGRPAEYEAAWWKPYSRSDAIRTFASALKAAAWLRAQAGKPVEGSIIRKRGVEGWRVVGSWPGLPPEGWREPMRGRADPGTPAPAERRVDDGPVPYPPSPELKQALGIR